jgi:hypothetical protein
MADEPTTSPVTETAPQTQPAPTTHVPPGAATAPAIPAGMKMVSESEYAKMQQMADRFKPFADKDPADLQKAYSTYEDLRKHGADPDMVAQMFRGKQESPAQPAQPDYAEEARKVTQSEMAKWTHQQGVSQQRQLEDGLVKSLVGEAQSDAMRYAAESIVEKLVYANAPLYPDGHPLKGKLAPMSQSEFDKLVAAEAKKYWAEFSTQKRPDNGAPSPGQSEPLENRPDPNKPMSKDQERQWLLSEARKRFEKIQGAPVSSA